MGISFDFQSSDLQAERKYLDSLINMKSEMAESPKPSALLILKQKNYLGVKT